MHRASKSLHWAMFFSLLPFAPWTAAAEADYARLPLRGIAAVVLVIDGVDEELAPYGLGRASLIAAAAERLTQAGMEVISADDLARRPDAAVLTLRIRLMRTLYYFYLYGIKLSLNSKVTLAQSPDAYTTVETWTDGSVGTVQPTDVASLHSLSLQLLDGFIALHAQQNPG